MKFQNISEGISPVVYHFTSLYGAGKILAEDRFRLSASFANDSEREAGSNKQFFLSVTRSKTGGYTLRSASNMSAVMVLDGKALAQNYAGGPVQYFSRGMIGIDSKFDEMEDRIYHSEPFITNVKRYVEEIHVLITSGMSVHGRKAIAEIKRSGIPLFLYDDERQFLLQRKETAKPLSAFELPKDEPQDRYPSYDRVASNKMMRRRKRKETGKDQGMSYDLSRWIELMIRPVDQWDRMHYNKKDIVRGLQWGHSDAINSLSADLHNAKNNPKEIAPMARLMRRHKLKSARDIIEFIKQRWQEKL